MNSAPEHSKFDEPAERTLTIDASPETGPGVHTNEPHTGPTFDDALELFSAAGRDTSRCDRPLASFRGVALDDISQDMIDHEARRHYPNAPSSTITRQFITPVSAILNFAADQSLCARRVIKRPPQKRQHETPLLHPADADRIAEHCTERFRPLFLCLLLTGTRASECVSLRWEQIDLIQRQVRFPATESTAGRKIPLRPRLFEALVQFNHRDGAVFRRPDGTPYERRGNGGASIRHVFGEACRRAGVSNLCVRDLRRAWARYEFALHRNLDQLMYRGGWRDERLLGWCRSVSVAELDDLREAYGRWLQHDRPAQRKGQRPGKPTDESTIKTPIIGKRASRRDASSWSRLLTREEAARYCRLGLSAFLAICPVRPLCLGKSKRLERYDIRALDEWIDRLGEKGSSSPGSNWLGLVEKPNDRRAR